MKLTEKFNLRSMNPMPGALSGLWISLQPKEVADAYAAGTGPGVADTQGTPTPGTLVPGQIVVLDANGQCVLMTSQDLTANMPKLPFVLFSGDNDFSGSFVGEVLAFHGGSRLDTEKFDAGSYTPGLPLIANAGNFALKAAAADHIQIVGYVGPRGAQNGVLDVLVPQGVAGY